MKARINDNIVEISKVQIREEESFHKRVLFNIKDLNGNEEIFNAFITSSALSDIKISSNVVFVEFVWGI